MPQEWHPALIIHESAIRVMLPRFGMVSCQIDLDRLAPAARRTGLLLFFRSIDTVRLRSPGRGFWENRPLEDCSALSAAV